LGAYDLVVDVDQNGQFNDGDILDSDRPVGFMIQQNPSAGSQVQLRPQAAQQPDHRRMQLACEFIGEQRVNYKDVFTTMENVYMYVNPSDRIPNCCGVQKYVVRHQDMWDNGDPLVDVTVWDGDTVQSGCINQAPRLIWPAPLRKGCYDAIMDVTHDGLYTKGVDLLDDRGATGSCTGGFFVTEPVVINEIMFDPEGPDAGNEWVELYNLSDTSPNIGGWVISNRDASLDAVLPAWDFPPNTYLIVHFGFGANDSDFSDGMGECHTGNSVEVFDNARDRCGLYMGSPSSDTILDFVAWCRESPCSD
jgi:hypothetical protein